ncbi:MAG TPA: DMT family transporter [Candidatus Brocadiia bacterium]|nr:DMT family transporter [Candidatus Brocadiia bacterium]
MNNNGGRDGAALFAAAGATLCYGATPVFIKYFTGYLDAWTVNGLRYSVGALFWLPFVILVSRKGHCGTEIPNGYDGIRPVAGIWKAALIPAAINCAGQVGWGLTPYYLDATVIGFVYKLHFLFTILCGFALIRAERPLARDPWFWAGTVVCIAGVVLMFARNLGASGSSSATGMALLIAATALFGAYAVAVKQCVGAYPARLSFGVISLYTAAGLVTLMFLVGDFGRISTLQPRTWGFIVVSALIGIAFAHVLYYRAIQGLGAVISTGLMMATPFVTLLGAALFLGEKTTPLQLAGGLAVVAGGVMLAVSNSRLGRAAAAQLPASDT